ncbi:MAG: S8 family serine peptidase [Bacteroidota bacterium]
MRLFLFACALCLGFSVNAQVQDKIWVEFKDKKNSPYSIDKPEEFLSERAIERRARYDIAIAENDLPVNPQYLKRLESKGVKVHITSKWLNGAIVLGSKAQIEDIKDLPFVHEVEVVGKHHPARAANKINSPMESKSDYKQKPYEYGYAKNQIEQVNGQFLHERGLKGQGMIIAVLDGGFSKADVMPFFDSLRVNDRWIQGWDFVNNDNYPYEASSHGTQVMSTMGANLPGLMIGTAPEATYVCVRTEEVGSELKVEEYNWVAGAEYADSLGADVINSSLGYTTFDRTSMNYKYKDLDGNTAIVTIGADFAASKGLLVVTSAGNEGGDSWNYVGAPADANDILSVGSVDKYGNPSFFSSYGPTADGRVKPNVSGTGSSTIVASLYGYHTNYADGTSYSSPVIAGIAASLWAAFPDKTNLEIIEALEKSSSLYDSPDVQMGYGIPDMEKAFNILKESQEVVASVNSLEGKSGELSLSESQLSKSTEDKLKQLIRFLLSLRFEPENRP